MGNICRSPAAEGVMCHLLEQANLDKQVKVDSAGTIGHHAGNQPDARMQSTSLKRSIRLQHCARQVRAQDLAEFDLILVMDQENLRDVFSLDPSQKFKSKIKLFCEFCTLHALREVPDPYYGGNDGFELVLDLLEDGCAEIIKRIQAGTLIAR